MFFVGTIANKFQAFNSLLKSIFAVYKGEPNVNSSLSNYLFAVYKGENNGNDALGNYNGTVTGGVTYVTGKNGNCWQFNGSNGYVSLPTNAFNFNENFSFNIWVNFTSFGAPHCIFSNYGNGGNDGWYLYQNGQNLQFTMWNNGTPYGASTTGNLLTTGWRMITVVRTMSSNTKIYLDGVLILTDNTTTNPTYRVAIYPAIGVRKYDNGVTFDLWQNEKQDELTIWNKALSSTEVSNLYTSYFHSTGFYSTIITDSLGNNNGTAQGSLTYALGKSGNCFNFNGSNSYINIPGTPFNFIGDFSISLWFNANSFGQVSLFGNYQFNTSRTGWRLGFEPGDVLTFFTYGSATVSLASPTTFSANTWYNVVVTRKASSGTKMYVNGVLNVSNSDVRDPSYISGQFNTIGALQYDIGAIVYFFNGKIDEVVFHTKELTSAEVADSYNNNIGKFYPNF